MRIVHIFTGLNTGGAEMMMYKLLESNSISRNGMILSLLSNGEMEPRFKSLGMSVKSLGMSRGRFSLAKFIKLIKILKKEKPDLVSTWLYHADLVGGLAGRLLNIPVCWNVGASAASLTTLSKGTKFVIRICAFLSSWIPVKIIFNSKSGLRDHVALGYKSDKCEVIPNGFNLELFKPDGESRKSIRKEINVSGDCKLVGIIGRYDPIKNHEGFIKACSIVAKTQKNAHFIMVGTGIDDKNKNILRHIEESGIKEKIHLLGLRQDIPRITSSLDVLVCPSWGEAFPNVVGEAMSCGVPCVVTDVGDSAYVVQDTGIVVPSGNTDALAEGILKIINLPKKQWKALSQSARKKIMDNYEIGNIGKHFEALYRKLQKS
jgi:glycosyltransferase involved in cell wall biosynthesis